MSLYTVSRELGHGSEEMVRRVYSHLGTFRHRSEVVEYRVEQRFERLGDQLIRLGLDTKIDTSPQGETENSSPAHTEVQGGMTFRSGPGATRTRDLLLQRGIRPLMSADQQCTA